MINTVMRTEKTSAGVTQRSRAYRSDVEETHTQPVTKADRPL